MGNPTKENICKAYPVARECGADSNCKGKELAEYTGKHIIDIYANFILAR